MLVHGGGHDSRCWAPLLPHLNGPTLAVDLPGRGAKPGDLATLRMHDLVNSAVADLDAFDQAERVVLIGHSLAGILIPEIAARRPDRVAHLVFLSCFVPAEGQTVADEMTPLLRVVSRGMTLFHARPVPKAIAKRMFCNDMTPEQTALTLSGLVPEAPGLLHDPVTRLGLPPATVIPRTFIKTLRDRVISPETQDRFISNVGNCEVRSLNAGHDAMISSSLLLAKCIEESVGRRRD
ncbi:alpha/beta fold hydrolase [Pseudarthrobacter oxydans]|uniref:alpha/beta fold hydrolase n=1 Tax=Pseudarthrobacter oxydans TaxID=1671 RepID=UPI00286AF430|nr:alpha/beta fold hydrolase [Pseudarthrobacter oxydans]